MALSDQDVADIVRRYDRGAGETVSALAEAFGVTGPSITYHLKKHHVYGADGPKQETDAELGIDEDDTPPVDQLAALMNNPAFKSLVDAAVASRLAQMGASPASSPTGDFKALADSLAHMIEVSQAQQPGYIKPLPAHEVDRRSNAYVEMKALLKRYEQEGNAPLYTLGEGGMFECTNAVEYRPFSKIRTFLPPPEDAIPENEAAKRVHEQMIIWIGGHTPDIGDQIEKAMREAHQAPLVSSSIAPTAPRGPITLVEDAPTPDKASMRPRRQAGTLVTERHGMSHGEAMGPQFHDPNAVAA